MSVCIIVDMTRALLVTNAFHRGYSGASLSLRNLTTVTGIRNGMPLFLLHTGNRLMYGVFEATGAGGKNLERDAFDRNFPAQVCAYTKLLYEMH